MLVLTRKLGEAIRLGDDIEVTVSQISGHRVQLAISAPRLVSVRRAELTGDPPVGRALLPVTAVQDTKAL
jgi:carbon storage regulator